MVGLPWELSQCCPVTSTLQGAHKVKEGYVLLLPVSSPISPPPPADADLLMLNPPPQLPNPDC